MKRIAPTTLILALVALAGAGCAPGLGFGREVRGSGAVVTQDRPIQGVSGVELGMQGTLSIEFGESESLRVVAEENLQEYIETDIVGGTLRIGTPAGVYLSESEPIEFYLTVTQLDTLQTASGGSIEVPGFEADPIRLTVSSSGDLTTGALQCRTLSIQVSSSGDLTVESLQAESIDVHISSSGSVDIGGGAVQIQDLTLTSSGNYSAPDLTSLEASLQLSSSGAATVRVSGRLTADLSSSGNVYYYGSPRLDVDSSSSGDVRQAGN